MSSAKKSFSNGEYENGIKVLMDRRIEEVQKSIKKKFNKKDIDLISIAAMEYVTDITTKNAASMDPLDLIRKVDERLCPWTAMIMARRVALDSLEKANYENDIASVSLFRTHIEEFESSLVKEQFPIELFTPNNSDT